MTLSKRKRMRLPEYNYTAPGAYFITICTHQREALFGTIEHGIMVYSEIGQIAAEEISVTNQIRQKDGIQITKSIVMPNHVHMIIEIVGPRLAVAVAESGTANRFGTPLSGSVSSVVRSYKAAVTKHVRESCGHGKPCPYKLWQPRFYDHVIRSERDYQEIWRYIDENPVKWEMDSLFSG